METKNVFPQYKTKPSINETSELEYEVALQRIRGLGYMEVSWGGKSSPRKHDPPIY